MTDRKELIDRLRYAHEHSQQRVNGSDIFKEAADALEAERCAVVKPLEWRHVPEEPQGYTWRAKKPFGSSYYIHEKDGLYSWGDGYVSLEEAKAAAQADYGHRVLSTITIRPASEVAAEAAALAIEAAKYEAADQENACVEWYTVSSEHANVYEQIPIIVGRIDAIHTDATRAALERMKKGGE